MSSTPRPSVLPREAVVFWSVAACFVLLLVALRVAAQALLLTFAGVLFGTAFRGLAQFISTKLGWRLRWSLLACLGLVLALAAAAALWIIPHVADQITRLSERLSGAYGELRRTVATSPWAAGLFEGSHGFGRGLRSTATKAAGLLSSAVGALGGFAFVVFIALYIAWSPGPYRRGILCLVPPGDGGRTGEILAALGSTLHRWMLGRLVSMTAVGLATAVGLWATGIPLPGTLGLLAGVLGFVPNIGPVVSAVPAALLASPVGPVHVLYVLGLYLAINLADGYGLTPWIQKKAIAVPPALVITGQVLAGTFWGALGVMFATPLLACLLVLVRELYVRGRDARAADHAGARAPSGEGQQRV